MTDALLERLAFEPDRSNYIKPGDITWPDGLAPKLVTHDAWRGDPLPKCDVLVVTWTSAEWMALADTLSPGWPKAKWSQYGRNWSAFVPHLTSRSPAREAKCLGEYTLVTIGSKTVCLFHSQLHLATDDDTAPVVALWQQLIPEAQPELVITTGTAGGIGSSTGLGDVAIVGRAKFNCTKMFASKPWAQQRFIGPQYENSVPSYGLTFGAPPNEVQTSSLVEPAWNNLPEDLRNETKGWVVTTGGDVETVDYFGFDDTDDSYGIVKNDPDAHTEEMDDATLPLAISGLRFNADERLRTDPLAAYAPPVAPPRWLSIRNASDPEVPSSIGDLEAQKKWASSIYEKYGYWTTVCSAVACWAVIAEGQE